MSHINIRKYLNKVFWITALLISGIGGALIWYTTTWGPGLMDWDSFNYVAGARNVASGHGYILPVDNQTNIPLTHFPPGLPLILAVSEKLGMDVIPSARYINIFLFSINALLLMLMVKRITQTASFGLIVGLLFISFAPMIEAHTWLLSEPLFLFCSITGFYFLDLYLEKQNLSFLIIASFAFGYAFLTRYAGIANLVTAGIFLLISQRIVSSKRRLTEIVYLGFLTGLPAVSFTLYNYFQTSKINNRELGWYPLNINNLVNAFHVLYGWVLPDVLIVGLEKFHFYLLVTIVLTVILTISIYGYKKRGDIFYFYKALLYSPITLQIYFVFFFIYVLVIFASKTFLDPNIGMSDRIFLPVYVAFIVLVTGIGGELWRTTLKAGLRILILLPIVYLFLYNFTGSMQSIPLLHDRGLGLDRKVFHNSEAIQELKILAGEKIIFSNYAYALYLQTGQIGYPLGAFDTMNNSNSNKAIVAIFTFRLKQTHPFIEKYKDRLDLIAQDDIVSIFSVKPK